MVKNLGGVQFFLKKYESFIDLDRGYVPLFASMDGVWFDLRDSNDVNLLLQRIQEDPGGVLEQKGGVREAERLRVRTGEGERGAQRRLAVGSHV